MQLVVLVFLVVFFLILFAVSLALNFLDRRRKRQVVELLQTAAGEPVVSISTLLKEVEPDRTTGFQGLLQSLQFTKHAQQQLQQAGMTWPANKLLGFMGLLTIPGLLLGIMVPFLVNQVATAIIMGAVFGMLPYIVVRRKRAKRLELLEQQFPESLDFLSRSMRAGHAFSISLEMLGDEMPEPLGGEYRALFNEQNLGAPLDVALHNFTVRVPLLDVRFFTSSVLLQKQTGGNLSEILTRLAYVIRERFRLRGQVKAASAHGRLTATILTVLPVATLLGLLVVAPGYLQGMAEDPDGKKMIAGAIVAQVLGNISIRKIINIKV
jgi:tight adherence protein B